MRYHFPAYFGKLAEAPGNCQEAIFVQIPNIAGIKPVVIKSCLRLFRLIQITDHDLRSLYEDDSFFLGWKIDLRIYVADSDHGAGDRQSYCAWPCAIDRT